MWRSHQAEFLALCQAIATGETRDRHIIASITPGGGKSALPIIAAATLIPAIADRVAWFVPRAALQQQAIAGFYSPLFRGLLGHRLRVGADLGVGSGFVATYQSLAHNAARYADAFAQHRYILVLDEPHHAPDGSEWATAIAPLVKRSALVLQMSGTFQRHDGKPVAFLPYKAEAGTQWFDPDHARSQGAAVVEYPRSRALQEQAIIPLEVRWFDLSATWQEDGRQQTLFSLADAVDEGTAKAGIYIALRSGAATEILMACYRDWLEYRQINCRSKLLVVAATMAGARSFQAALTQAGAKRVGIAVSAETTQAHRNIERFKASGPDRLDILCTVAMAYEGLDVPSCTHIACLTNIRSAPWIEQMVTRACRVDRGENALPYDQQAAYLYCPDDILMRQCVEAIIEQQQAWAIAPAERLPRQDSPAAAEPLPPEEKPAITAVSSQAVLTRLSNLEGDQLTAEEMGLLPKLARLTGTDEALLRAMPIIQIKGQLRAYASMLRDPLLQPVALPRVSSPAAEPETASTLRRRIHHLACQRDREYGYPPGTTNSDILRRFKTRRDLMTPEQLQAVEHWLRASLRPQPQAL